LALTATATEKVLADLQEAFAVSPEHVICTGFYRENLTLQATPITSSQRDGLLIERLKSRDSGPTIVYVTLQKTAERVAELLSRSGFVAQAYHAGMKSEDRDRVQNWFLESQEGIVVATIAFGMGVDKSNIRYVYHYNIPKSLENYAQEIGRSGRDGLPSVCETLISMEDLNILENFAYGDTPTQAAVRSLVRQVFSLGEEFHVSYYELSSANDIRLLVVRTLLTYLELLKFLEGGTPFYSEYRFQPLMPSEKILAKFPGEKRQFLLNLFKQAKKAKTWFDLDLEQAARTLNATRDRIVTALDYLAEKQMLVVKAQGLRNRYRRLKPCEDMNALADELHHRLVEHEQRSLERLHHLLELAAGDECYWNSLSRYFGEQRSGPCGHCGWCLEGNRPITIPDRPAIGLDGGILSQVEPLRRRYAILREPQSLARFLCGVTSPKLTAARLSSNPLFGAAGHVPFAEVLSAIDSGQHNPPEQSNNRLELTEQEQTLVRQFIQDFGGADRAKLALEMISEVPE
jgi:ATP-dependent DNA helicase RecQ